MSGKKEAVIGVIGLGGRGRGMMRTLLAVDNTKVTAVCDKYEDRAENAQKIAEEISGIRPDAYTDYHELIKRDDITAVMICTTWITHIKIAIDCMKAGKDVAIEVGGAASIEECWDLVKTSQETGKFCMFLENCCYAKNELAVFNMERQGHFGEIVHAQGGYQHDLRKEIAMGVENRHGRLRNFMNRNGELYPTHQLGPIAKLLRINRGNRMLTLTSMSSKSRGLNAWIKERKGEDDVNADYAFTQGDIVTTMIKCAHGETICLIHDCSLPRVYSRNGRVQGTNGIWMEDGAHIYLEKDPLNPDKKLDVWETWDSFEPYEEAFRHPLWKEYINNGVKEGHDGIDYLVLSAFVDTILNEITPPIDVYDMASWMVITALSEQSVAMGSMPVPIPDFTNGAWIEREPFRRSKYCLEEVCEECFDNE